MRLTNKIVIALCAGLLYLSPAIASNFVCGQDLDGDGDVTGSGETTSCTQIGTEQFCSIGALSCSADIKYQCSIDNEIYSGQAQCIESCTESISSVVSTPIEPIRIRHSGIVGGTSHYRVFSHDHTQGRTNILSLLSTGRGIRDYSIYYGPVGRIADRILNYRRGAYIDTHYYKYGASGGSVSHYRAIRETTVTSLRNSACTPPANTTYTCPTAGNSCVNNNGVQQCSPNTCIDLDVTPPIDIEVPSTTVVDDGERNAQGACLDQALMFTGRNLSCKYKGLTENCCKDNGVVLTDSTGSLAGSIARDVAINAIGQVVSAAYTGYREAYAFFGDVELAATQAQWSAEAAIGNIGIDPTTIAISIAVHVVTELIACEQQDAETAILNGSGYCHYVGNYCSKKWPLVGCVQKSKSFCCFNSKLGRILQQQGREQMGIGWGTPKSPSCGGFTPAQFQAIDFSRIDMSEYYADIKSKGESLIQQNITQGVESFYQQIRQ